MPKWNWCMGHLPILTRYLGLFPPNTFINVIIKDIAKDFADTEIFYLDLWPFLAPNLVVCNPEAAAQVSL